MPAPRRLRKTEVHRLLVRERRVDLIHPLDLLQLALRLRRFARLRAEAIRKLLQRRDLLLLILVGRRVLLFARSFLLNVAVPIPAITHELPPRDLNDRTDE